MGDIGDMVAEALRAHGLTVQLMPFAQNTLRDEQGFVRTLKQTLATCRPAMIWPIGHPMALSRLVHGRRPDWLSPDILVPIAKPDVIERLDNKVACSRLATETDIPQPRFYAKADEVERWPVIFKRERSFGGSGVYRPYSAEALERLIANEKGRGYLIEEYIDGEDVSVDVVRWGNVCHGSCYRTLARIGRHGPATERAVCHRPDLVDYGRQLLEAAGFEGVCGMDFRVAADGRVCFLECNPRFTGGVRAQLEAGFDIPWTFYQSTSK